MNSLTAADRLALKASVYRDSPVDWVQRELREHLWSKQREIFESVRDNRRTAVHSCHGSGKSFTAARVALWWLEIHEPGTAFVVTSAPTGRQVKAILWREIGRAHAKAGLPGRTNQTELWVEMAEGNEEMVAFGFKPSEHDPAAFQGIHARYVLVIFDEAAGMPDSLWDDADSLIANDDSRFLVIGNPEDPTSEFAKVCQPGSGWNAIKISAFDTPNFTGEKVPEDVQHVLVGPVWVEEKKRKWGETNPMYVCKVLGEFPDVQDDGLIPVRWVKAAQDRTLEREKPVELGVDVGGGGDKSVIACRWGPVVRVIAKNQNPDTMQTTGLVLAKGRELGATKIKIDEIGIGKGVVDRAKELGRSEVEGINVGRQPDDTESFANRKAEGWWGVRERFQEGSIDIDPDDEDLAAQLCDMRYKRTSAGKIQVESKDEMKRRGKTSPDEADAVMLCFLPPPKGEYAHVTSLVLGRRR